MTHQIRGDSTLRNLPIAPLRPKVVWDMKNSYEIMHLFWDKIGRSSLWLFGLFRLFHEMRPDLLRDILRSPQVYTRGINRGYYIAAPIHEISLRGLKTFHEWALLNYVPFYVEFKVAKCYTKTCCLCWVLRSKLLSFVAWLSRTFSTFLDHS